MMEAVHAGNDAFNPRRVERALAERAIGFSVDLCDWVDDDETGERVLKPTSRKYYPPDVTAMIFFLKNRMKVGSSLSERTAKSGRMLQVGAHVRDNNSKESRSKAKEHSG